MWDVVTKLLQPSVFCVSCIQNLHDEVIQPDSFLRVQRLIFIHLFFDYLCVRLYDNECLSVLERL